MKNVEKRLDEEKKRIASLTAPEELESRLRNALNTNISRKPNRFTSIWKLAAVAIFFMMIVGYNYNAFAFYGKKLIGFDELITGTLKDLNEEGMGQIVEKKTTLVDGTELTINGIMTDANQMIIYYTLANPMGIEDTTRNDFWPSEITGFLTNASADSGVSSMNDAGTELKGKMHFEPASPFSKKLTLHFLQHLHGGQITGGSVSFPYNPNKAMQTQIKQSIKKTLTVDKGTITFDSITATPTVTVIKGSLNVDNFDRVNLGLHGIELIVNGMSVEIIGSSNRTSLKGSKFDIRFDALPEELNSLELVMKEFVGYQKLEEKIPLASMSDKRINLSGNELRVKDVSTTSQGVEIRIATDDDVMLDGVSIERLKEKTSLKTTVNQTVTMQADGRVMKERTLLFETMVEPEYLLIEGIHYLKQYDKKIEIPVD